MSLAITPIALLLAAATPTASPVGDWRGTSLCQVRPSPCNDEIFVYHISALPGRNAYRMVMNKLIAGKEESMERSTPASIPRAAACARPAMIGPIAPDIGC
jgi:hypothetical protein